MRCAAFAINRLPLGLAVLLVATSCGVERPSSFAPVCPSYTTAVQPVLDARCKECHQAGAASGGYRVDDYLQAVQPSETDVARVVAGDAQSPFMKAVRGETSPHHPITDGEQLKTLTDWAVACKAAPDPTQYHPIGWASPIDPADFHGTYLRDAGYSLIECQSCHGTDLRGGKAKVDCNSCHVKGPLACNTCHGDETSSAPPKALNGSRNRATLGVGAHRQHVSDGPLHLGFQCARCHPDVTSAEDEGHYRFGMKFVSDQPVVTLAVFDGGVATWDRSQATCTNGACHAPNAADVAATQTVPKWTSVDGSAAKCGTCHGLAPTGHVYNQHCEGCHTKGYADGGVDLAVHVNGKVDFGPGTDCGVCHSAPGDVNFRDTNGDQDAGSPTVGAHAAHLKGGTLRGPLGCEDCHLVPKQVLAVGHVDTPPPAEVFDPSWLGGLAKADGAQPVFSAASGTCGSVYCHGGGNRLVSQDLSPSLLRTPKWNGGSSQAACGTCHGTPPLDGRLGHSAVTTVQGCAQCHALSVNADGTIRFFSLADGGTYSYHLNGDVNGNTP